MSMSWRFRDRHRSTPAVPHEEVAQELELPGNDAKFLVGAGLRSRSITAISGCADRGWGGKSPDLASRGSYFRIFPSCGGASARYKSYNGPIGLRVKQREFISLVGGAAVNWLLAAERSKPSRCDRLCLARGIPTAAGNHRGRHYLTIRPCLDRRAVGSHGRPGAILVFVGRGWGQQRRSSACAITAYTMLSHDLPRLVTN